MEINVIVKPNAKKAEIIFDKEKNCYYANVKSPAEHNKANLELIKLFKKKYGWNARIVRGLTSKRKVLVVV